MDRVALQPYAPAVFLDRDGVLNAAVVRGGKPFPPQSEAELQILPGVEEACAQLRGAGLRLIVVSNQPDIGRGTQTRVEVDRINMVLRDRLRLDDVRICPHDDSDGCACRKPAPGLILEASRAWRISLSRSVMVGDRWRDVEAGARAGCKTVFVDHGYTEKKPASPDLVVASLADAVPWILDVSRLHGGMEK
jgi:D-glycero-D-manno-heptose 1,7-bisphosphate phosphatase